MLALPRGGLPVGYEVARALGAPLDVFVVRKLGVPGQEELAMGALAQGGVRVLDEALIEELDISPLELARATEAAMAEVERRQRTYRGEGAAPELRGKTLIVVDDGLATGSTMRAAVGAIRQAAPAKVVVAVPVGAQSACAALAELADELVCLESPRAFWAVGAWYQDFAQLGDAEVREILERARSELVAGRTGAPREES